MNNTKYLVTLILDPRLDEALFARLTGVIHVSDVPPEEWAVAIDLWGPRGKSRRTQGWAELRNPTGKETIEFRRSYNLTPPLSYKATVNVIFHMGIVYRDDITPQKLLRLVERSLNLTEPLSPDDPRIS